MDGLYGSIVIRQAPSKDPNSNLYDFDLTTHVMLLSDWMHEDAAERFPGRLAVNTGTRCFIHSSICVFISNCLAILFVVDRSRS